jgi:hypothetical protein
MRRRETLEAVICQLYPWDAPGLSRAERVIAFVEDLTVSSGKAANQKLRLRPWTSDWYRPGHPRENATNPRGPEFARSGAVDSQHRRAVAHAAAELPKLQNCASAFSDLVPR